jgi:hypothetical protein
MRSLLVAACATLACAVADADEGTLPLVSVFPPRTGVLLLPALDTEPWSANVLAQRQLIVRRRVEYEFIARQFKVSGEALARRAAELPPQIDLSTESGRSEPNLDALAGRTGASWVVGLTVQEVAADARAPGGDFHCHCQVLLRIWDATRHGWMENGSYIGHDTGGSSSPVWLFKESIDSATQVALAPLLGRYPETIRVAPVNTVGDYLKGQTDAFVGDPKVPFAGMGKMWPENVRP